MRWYDDLYVGYNLLDKKRQVMWKIKRGKQQFNKYVITLPFNDYDVLAVLSDDICSEITNKNISESTKDKLLN